MSKELTTSFDYAETQPETKGKLINLAGQIKKLHANYNRSLFEIGEVLALAHGVLSKHKQGTFTKWVESETGIESTTAYNYMYAWMRFHGFPNKEMISAVAMYKLAAPSAPPAAAKEAEKIANKGERVTVPMAADLIKKHKEKRSNSPTVGELQGNGSKGVVSNAETKSSQINTGKSETSEPENTVRTDGKISGGTSFNTEELEAAAPKPSKNGTTRVEFDDAKCKAAFVSLVKMLDDRWDIIGGTVGHRATATKHLNLSFEAYQKWVKG